MQVPYIKNQKTMLREIKDLNKWRKKNNAGDSSYLISRHYKDIVIMTVWYFWKINKLVEQIKESRNRPHVYSQLTWPKKLRQFNWRKKSLLHKWCWYNCIWKRNYKLKCKSWNYTASRRSHMVWGKAQEFAFQTSFPGDVHTAGLWTTFCHYFLTPWCKKRKRIQVLKFFSLTPSH